MAHQPAVYILASRPRGVLYVGVTSDLRQRIGQHRHVADTGSFAYRYRVHRLVWYELTTDMLGAIAHEKRLKRWRRAWKVELIESFNPSWDDLTEDVLGEGAWL